MATWGRTTDVEFVYGVTLNLQGQVVAEEFQGPNHGCRRFRGRHERTRCSGSRRTTTW